MPHDEPDETDPMMLVGVELEADAGTWLETAQVFAEEFARMGFGEEKLLSMFRNPFFAGPHRAYLAVGEEKVHGIIQECVAFWGRVSFREEDVDPESSLRLLPVVERGVCGEGIGHGDTR